MSRTSTLPRSTAWWAWIAVAALLLKAAVPLLATASAHAQGKALVEVCTVYGVATLALDGAAEAGFDAPARLAAQHGDDCALTSMLAFAAPQAVLHAPAESQQHGATSAVPHAPPARDACARWVAGLKHAPPQYA